MPNVFVEKKALTFMLNKLGVEAGLKIRVKERTKIEMTTEEQHWGELRRMMGKRQTRDYLVVLR